MPELWLALIIVGFVAGIAAGMFGIGGGVLIVPALTILLGFELKKAVGTSLTALLMPVSIFAVIAYYRAGKLTISTAAWVAAGIVFGAYFGAKVALDLNTNVLEQLYGVFLLFMAWRFAEPRRWWLERQGKVLPKPDADSEPEARAEWYKLFVLGITAGILSGLFGIGGGVVIVPALIALLKFEQKKAVGTSLAALLLPVSFPAVLEYYQSGLLSIPTAVCVAIGLIGGAFTGARIALGLPTSTVKRLYGLFLLFVGIKFILQF